MKKRKILAGAVLAGLLGATSANAALVAQWTGDGYVTGGNWTDSVAGAYTGTAVGTPVATPNAFGTHTGITFDGTARFTVPNSAPILGATAFTMAAVFNPSAANFGTASTGQFWQKAGLIGNEQPGGVNDWGLGFGAQQADWGIGNADTTLMSSALTLNTPHVIVGTWSTAGTMTLYVDGVQVAQNTTAPTGARTQTGSFGLGADEAAANGDLHPFIGSIAELRIYNDTSVDPVALSNTLAATYVPEPGSLALIGLSGLALLRRRRKAM